MSSVRTFGDLKFLLNKLEKSNTLKNLKQVDNATFSFINNNDIEILAKYSSNSNSDSADGEVYIYRKDNDRYNLVTIQKTFLEIKNTINRLKPKPPLNLKEEIRRMVQQVIGEYESKRK